MSQGSHLLKILTQKSHSQYVPCMNVEKSSSTCWHFGNKRKRSNAKGTTCTESSGRLHGGNIILVWRVRDGGGKPLEDKAKLSIRRTGISSSLTLPLSCWIYFRKTYLHFYYFSTLGWCRYRLVSNIRHTSNISRTPTLKNSQLEFSPTISLAKTSNTRCTPSFDFWVSIVDKVWSRPWDFDSLWITGPMTAHQSVAYVRHITLAPAVNLCTLSAIVFLPIKAWIWRHRHRYIDGSAILLTVKGPVWPWWLNISPCITTKIIWNKTAFW